MGLIIFIGILVFIGLVGIFTGVALIAIGGFEAIRGKEYPTKHSYSPLPDDRLSQDIRRINEIETLNRNVNITKDSK